MLDAYARRARLAPALLAGSPAMVLLVSGLVAPDQAARIVALLLGSAGLAICGFVRDAGRRHQPALWSSWGGPPTSTRLKWEGSDDPAATLRLHKRLSMAIDEPLPTEDDERIDPASAERRYEEVVAVLRERTRDRTRFPLVFAENVEYGFRRNCLGLRPVGLAIGFITLLVSALLVALGTTELADALAHWGVAMFASLTLLAFWLFVVNPPWVRLAADRYAERLLDAIDTLAQSKKATT